jgi:KTSC domain
MPSAAIRSFFYDVGSHSLTVVFMNGLRYDYEEVPSEVYRALSTAASKGQYFNENIRDRYPFRRFGKAG